MNDLKEKILTWESENGESFFDYFAHDAIHPISWTYWLLGKGFSEKANELILEMHESIENSKMIYLDIDMFEVYPEYLEERKYSNENKIKNVELLSEFLLATPHYTKKVICFFDEN